MSEDAIDPSHRVEKFENADDIAFAVEMENVTDKPITLLNTRYGSSFGDSSGKANSNWYGQFLFSIDLFDLEGKLIERPEVEVVTLDGILSSVGAATIEPGKTHRFLLRPSKWLSVFQRSFEPGHHRVAVRYMSPERIPLKPFFHEGTKAIRETLGTIKLTPKKKADETSSPAPSASPNVECEMPGAG